MKRVLAAVWAAVLLAGCSPFVYQHAARPGVGFAGPRLETEAVVSFDGARLGLTTWQAQGEPWAVIVGVHGMNDYANAFHLPAPWWAEQGITTYAYDQRGFGRSPQRGIWAGDGLMMEDLRTVTALVRAKYPHALIAVVGESMGGAVAAEAFASDRPPDADRLVLLSPAVWGWREQALPNKTLLWLAANLTAGKVYNPPDWLARKIWASDNHAELYAMGRDPLMVWGARSDTLYGLVSLMQHGSDAMGGIRAPTLYLYGAHDEIIPKHAAVHAADRLPAGDQTAYYAHGWHLLMRDKQAPVVWRDVAAFLRDPHAPLPSGAPPIPGAPALATSQQASAGLWSEGLEARSLKRSSTKSDADGHDLVRFSGLRGP